MEINERHIYGNGGTVRLTLDGGAFAVEVELAAGAEGFTLETDDGAKAIEFYNHPFAYLPADRPDPFARRAGDEEVYAPEPADGEEVTV